MNAAATSAELDIFSTLGVRPDSVLSPKRPQEVSDIFSQLHVPAEAILRPAQTISPLVVEQPAQVTWETKKEFSFHPKDIVNGIRNYLDGVAQRLRTWRQPTEEAQAPLTRGEKITKVLTHPITAVGFGALARGLLVHAAGIDAAFVDNIWRVASPAIMSALPAAIVVESVAPVFGGERLQKAAGRIRKVAAFATFASIGWAAEGLGEAYLSFQQELPQVHSADFHAEKPSQAPVSQPPDASVPSHQPVISGETPRPPPYVQTAPPPAPVEASSPPIASPSGVETSVPPTPPEVMPTPHGATPPEPIPAGTIAPTGAEVAGSVTSTDLLYNGQPWELYSNGVDNTLQLLRTTHTTGTIDNAKMQELLQRATELWTNKQLDAKAYPDLYKLFHLSNGTQSIFDSLQNNQTVQALKNLGVIR